MFEPIEGSEINKLAVLNQRYTFAGKFKPSVNQLMEIKIQLNKYVNTDNIRFPYVETMSQSGSIVQPINGLLVGSGNWGIAYNGSFSTHAKEPRIGSVLLIDGVLWMVSNVQKDRDMSLVDFATVNLDLTGVM